MNYQTPLPDFNVYGYLVSKLLSASPNNSVIVWQAQAITEEREDSLTVVIKQYCFATDSSSWSGYQTYQQERQLLQSLDHPVIPKFIKSFETENSFCFVREYLPGNSLADSQNLTAKNMVKIALKSLEILVYLQNQEPAIFHLNITPEHILVDQHLNVYLCGFSLLQNHNDRVDPRLIKPDNALFIAPEQWQNPNLATDLYGLGSTLEEVILRQLSIRLIPEQSLSSERTDAEVETPSLNKFSTISELKKLALNQPDLQDSEIDSDFQTWLMTMTESEVFDRYSDAATALEELKTSFWDEIATPTQNEVTKPYPFLGLGLSAVALFGLGIAIAVGLKIARQVTEVNFVNVAIALMGMVVIYLTQMAASTLITQEQTEKNQGIILAVTIPLSITVITGFIFGRGEAVAMSLAIIFAQVLSLVTTVFKSEYLLQKIKIWLGLASFSAIALGIICGFKFVA